MKIKLSIFCLWIAILPLFFLVQTSYADDQPRGAIQIMIEPSDVVAQGAQWKPIVTNAMEIEFFTKDMREQLGSAEMQRPTHLPTYVDWYASGTVSHYWNVHRYQIEFKEIPGWIVPQSPVYVDVRENRTATATGRYTLATGTLQVTIQPNEMVQAAARWRMDGGPWKRSDDRPSVPVGPHQVEYSDVPGWVKPVSQNVVIILGQEARITGSYIPATGNLRVAIQPQGAVTAGAKWRVDYNGSWQDSDISVTGLSLGSHRVEFKADIPGWIRPDSVQANIILGETSRLTGTYVDKGSLTVTIQPQAANTAGAKWSVDGSAWQDSGATVSNLRLASLRVQFKSLNDARWIIPEPVNVNIVSGQAAQATATYQRSPGSLSVVIFPPELRQAGAQWRIPGVSGGAWQNSEATVQASEGRQQLEFKEVTGWVKPTTQDVNITSLQSIQLRGDYRRPVGFIQVNIQPEEVRSQGAGWRIGEGGWSESGLTVQRLPGPYAIEYREINYWRKPSIQAVDIVDGQTASLTGTYQPVSGKLNVTIAPNEAVQAGAQWKVGDRPWKRSGELDEIPVGQHRVDFSTPAGWILSAPGPVNIVAGRVTFATGTFQRQSGSLIVTVQPQGAVSAGAQWRVDGGAWQNSGSTLSNIAAGQRNIEYKEIAGWIRPSQELANITGGQTTSLTKNYTQQPGSLQVTIQPNNATQAGAAWQVDGMGWVGSNAVRGDITPGAKQIEFRDVAGWTKPAPVNVTIVSGQTQRATGAYTRSTGLLRVIIQPGNVEAAGAQWRVDGGAWQASRQLLSNVTAGPHQVEYSEVAGWVKPPSENVNVIGGQQVQTTGTYQRR